MEAATELLVLVESPAHGEAGEMLELRWGEAAVAFAPHAAPVLLIGQAVLLTIRRAGDGAEARVHAFVLQCHVTDEARRLYRFQIEHKDGAVLDRVVNRRETPRVTPDPARPVRVVLTPPGGERPVTALLRDVAETGMSVLFAREEEWVLAPHAVLGVELRLPTRPDVVLHLRGEVRHRRLERTAVHYGLKVEPAEEDQGASRALLRDYVEDQRARKARRHERDSAA